MIIDTHIDGIPCQAELIERAMLPAIWFDEPSDYEFRVLDRRGYRALWLERKLDAESTARIVREFKQGVQS